MKPLPDPHYRHRFPPAVISQAVWLYHVFSLRLGDVELLLAERGIVVSHGALNSARLSPIAYAASGHGRETSGTWTKCLFESRGYSTIAGVPSISMALSSIFLFRIGAMAKRPNASSGDF